MSLQTELNARLKKLMYRKRHLEFWLKDRSNDKYIPLRKQHAEELREINRTERDIHAAIVGIQKYRADKLVRK